MSSGRPHLQAVASAQEGTRERLLRAARDVIEANGYSAATVLAIADRAGVAAGTLYRHFASKEELFVEVFRDVCSREVRAMQASASALHEGAPAVERLQTVLVTFARRALRNPSLAWALLAEPVDPLVDAERLAYRAKYTALLEEGLREGVAAGELPQQDTRFTAAAIVGACGEALVGPLSPLGRGERDAERVFEAIRIFVARAIGAA
jgi:AcrR family transcriptional regulator